MKIRYFISAKEAQKILHTQEETSLFDYFFSDAHNDAELDISEGDVINRTEFSIVEEDGEYTLDWKNSISGLGNHYWGHDPMSLENNTGFMRFPLNECAKEEED